MSQCSTTRKFIAVADDDLTHEDVANDDVANDVIDDAVTEIESVDESIDFAAFLATEPAMEIQPDSEPEIEPEIEPAFVPEAEFASVPEAAAPAAYIPPARVDASPHDVADASRMLTQFAGEASAARPAPVEEPEPASSRAGPG